MSAEIRQQAVGVLRQALVEESRWVRVHAAESLLSLDYPQDVVRTFREELETASHDPEYRIGIWRVLASATTDDRQRAQWIDQIVQVFLQSTGRERVLAAETLGKLQYVPQGAVAEEFDRAAQDKNDPLSANARWVLACRGRTGDEAALVELLRAENPSTRTDAAYALRHMKVLSSQARDEIRAAADREPANSPARIYLVAAACVHARPLEMGASKACLMGYAEHGTVEEKAEACAVLGSLGTSQDLPLLRNSMLAKDPDVRIRSATAILRIGRRAPHRIQLLDWIVIAGYFLVMLAIGYFYSVRSKNSEDYLLGGRRMNPWAVGVSLFAALLSTIPSVSWPGEMVRYGPLMILGCVASYPLVGIVVGWFMIPFIMRPRITSAYALLDTAIGGHVRLLGSLVFLLIRIIWMAIIIFFTSSKVLIPLMGLSAKAVPYSCAIMGVVVVVFTSMGGLRAIVVTDVVQTIILLSGAVLTFVVISISLGGFHAWWPHEWPSHWPQVVWGFDLHARMTFVGVVIAISTWYMCVSCSDQMAIQRYLSTGDVRTARIVLATSLTVDGVMTLFLGLLGLPLLAYFRANPHLVPDGQTILGNPDTLFPRFIVSGLLPIGITELIIAGLLAAAMSHLSSGLNSSCSVVMADLLKRETGVELPMASDVKVARAISWSLGAFVVLLSVFVESVRGSFFEVAFKLVNLLAAPLAGLFLMAMFVKRTTPIGAYIGFAAGFAVCFFINYWMELNGNKALGFIWSMPIGLLVQIAVGILANYVPVRRNVGNLSTSSSGSQSNESKMPTIYS